MKTQHSSWFVIIVACFVSALIASNILAVKLIDIFGFIVPAAVIVFPLSYMCGDVLTEVYGYRQSRGVIWLGFFCNASVTIALWVAQILPSAPFWNGQSAYEQILGVTPRLLVASFLAYLVGEFVNAFVLARMKIATNGRWLWARTIGSTLAGQGLDSLIFITIAFWGTTPLHALPSIIATQWIAKTAYESLATPLTYVVVNFLKRREGLDVFDNETRFNPLSVID